MNKNTFGSLLKRLRKEKHWTQLQLAEQLFVSDRTVSKWERDAGLPEVSMLTKLSSLLEVNLEKMLEGDLAPNPANGGHMKRLRFYQCDHCGNILTALSDCDVSCCGRTLEPLTPKQPDDLHKLHMTPVENDFYLTFDHPMTKTHYLTFLAYLGINGLMMVRLYPEQGGEVRIPQMFGGKLFYGCSQDGLFVRDGKPDTD